MSMTTEEIEQRLVEKVCEYTSAAKRLRMASLEESKARSSSSSMVILLGLASERARLELLACQALACQAEAWLFTLSDMLDKAREEEAASHGDEE